MVVKDGERWRRVNSRKIRGHWGGFSDAPEGEKLENQPDIFITIDGRVPKNMSGEGTEKFELWPVKHHGNYRYTGRRYYDYTNSYGYYYSVKQYTYWDGYLHSHTRYYTTDQAIDYLEKCMYHTSRHHAEYLEHGKTIAHHYHARPFFVPNDERFVKARYRFYHPKHGRKHPNNW